MKKSVLGIEWLTEQTVKRIARVIGPLSAAQKALDRAKEIGGECVFWRTKDAIFVASKDALEIKADEIVFDEVMP